MSYGKRRTTVHKSIKGHKKDILRLLIDKFSPNKVDNDLYNKVSNFPTLRSVECIEDVSDLNLRSNTFLFNSLISLRMLNEPKEPVTLDSIKSFHQGIVYYLFLEASSIAKNIKNDAYNDPPDLRMVNKILEEGYLDAAKRVLYLIQLEYNINTKKYLCTARNLFESTDIFIGNNFNLIRTFLLLFRKADKFIKLGKIEEATTIYLKLAIFYDNGNPLQQWLVFEFYILAINTCEGYKKDFGLTEATVRYLFGRFCLLRFIAEGLTHLQKAFKLSSGRSWTASGFSGIRDDYIYSGTKRLLYLAHIGVITEKEITEPNAWLHHLQEAQIKSSNEEEYRDLLIPLADAFMKVKNYKFSNNCLTKYIKLATNNPNIPEEMSLKNVDFLKNLELRFFYNYTLQKNYFLSIEHLFNVYKLAKLDNDELTLAFVYKYYGLFCVKEKCVTGAKCMLRHSFRMYLVLQDQLSALEISFVLARYKLGKVMGKFDEVIEKICEEKKNEKPYKKSVCKMLKKFLHYAKPFWKKYELEEELENYEDSFFFGLRKYNDLKQVDVDEPLNKHERLVLNVYHYERPLIKAKLEEKRSELYYLAKGKKHTRRESETFMKSRSELVDLLKHYGINYTIPGISSAGEEEFAEAETSMGIKGKEILTDFLGSSSDEDFYFKPDAVKNIFANKRRSTKVNDLEKGLTKHYVTKSRRNLKSLTSIGKTLTPRLNEQICLSLKL